MATSGEKRWPPVGNFVAASGEKPMAIDTRTPARSSPGRTPQLHAPTIPGLVTDREIARCLRQNRDPFDVTAAWVLYRALTRPSRERAREALRNPAEHAAAQRLIAAGLLEDDNGVLRPAPRAEATFQAPPERRWLR
jgi:hypothetical protein